MKKIIVFVGMFLCASLIFAKDLQTALKEAAEQFSASLKPKSVVAIRGIYSESEVLNEFMLDSLTLQFISLKKIFVADRTNLDAIQNEMKFQLSGEVSIASMKQLGAKVGAETVIQGTLNQFKPGIYTLSIRALDVETAKLVDMYQASIVLDKAENKMILNERKAIEAQEKKREAEERKELAEEEKERKKEEAMERAERKEEEAMERAERKAIARAKSRQEAANNGYLSIAFQNMLFGIGSYRVGHYGDGAFLTVSHAIGWIGFYSGLGLILADRYIEDVEAGIALLSVGVIVEAIAIGYGFFRPIAYRDAPSMFAYGNKSGFKFDLVNTSKGDIAPQISYIHRY